MDIVDELLAAAPPAFARAIRAIIRGDAAALRTELAAAPDLAHARSGSIHRATLLHYVAANGIDRSESCSASGEKAIVTGGARR